MNPLMVLNIETAQLFIALMHLVSTTDHNLMGLNDEPVSWRSKLLSDGTEPHDGFVAGVELPNGETIACLMPIGFWLEMELSGLLCVTLPRAKEHTNTTYAVFQMVSEVYSL